MMKCYHCGKEIVAKKSPSIYTGGKLTAAYCSLECMSKALKRLVKVVKKMSREDFVNLLDKIAKEQGEIPHGEKRLGKE